MENLSSSDMKRISKLNSQYDGKSIKIGNKHSNKVPLSIFTEGMAVTDDIKDFLNFFDADKNGTIGKSEAAVLKKVLYEYAQSDKVLDKKEFASIYNLDENSPKTEKLFNQLQTLVTRQTTGTSTTTRTDKRGNKITSTFNSDGSGTQVIESKDSQGRPRKTVSTYGKDNKLLKNVTTGADGTYTSEYSYGENGKRTSEKSTMQSTSGKILQSTDKKYTYDENGKILSTQSETKTFDKKTGKATGSVKTTSEYKNGKIAKSSSFEIGKGKPPVKKEYEYNEHGKPSHTTISQGILKNNKLEFRKTQENNYEYRNDGTLAKVTKEGVDATQKPFSVIENYAPNGKDILNKTISQYKRGALIKDYYDGPNLENRIPGGLPTTRIEYEADGKTVKEKTVNKFDSDGVYIGKETYDKNGKLTSTQDFSKVDFQFNTAYQIGRGDCYLLASINALSQTADGVKTLQQNVKQNPDGSYTITFPGVKSAKQSLISGKGGVPIPTNDGKTLQTLPEDKVYIQNSYTISAEEFAAAQKQAGYKYSAGDKDVLLYEVAYEKYRNDVMKTIKANNINPEKTIEIAGLDIGGHVKEGDYLSGGTGSSTIFILTGRQANQYINPEGAPVCYVDSDYNMHLPNSNGYIEGGNRAKALAASTSTTSDSTLDDLISKLQEDSKDGKIDDYAAVASFNVSSQEVNGRVLKGGGHALTVVKVTDDKVILSNPWSPDDHIEMTIEDFKKAAKKLSCTPLNTNAGNSTTPPVNNNGSGSGQSPTPPSGNSGGNGNVAPGNGQPAQNPSSSVNVGTYTVPKGAYYTNLIKDALIQQGIEPTPTNIKKAKAQFAKANPGAVHTYNKPGHKYHGNKYLIADAKVNIPQFQM